MSSHALLVAVAGVVVAALGPIAGAQSNDSCSTPTPITTNQGVWNFDTRGATTDGAPNAACSGGGGQQIYKDLWYCLTAWSTGLTTVSTCGGNYLFDTKIAVYDGCTPCPEGAGILGCSDDDADCSPLSRVDFMGVRGHSYLLRIGGTSPDIGGVSIFTISPPPCPCDWNGDGVLNSQDFFAFINDFFVLPPGGCLPCVDFNGDGIENSQDLNDFINCFFAGCP